MTGTDLPVVTGLVVMVPEAAAITPYAHITLLAPFGADSQPTASEIGDAADFFSEVVPFAYSLIHASTFPDGTRYLSVEPANTFSGLTHDLHRLFPSYPPYGGEFDVVVPHLTIPERAAPGSLPIHGLATEATLLRFDGAFTVLETFPFGTSAA